MTWKNIADRLKSPVVCFQIASLIVTGVVANIPNVPPWIVWSWGIVAAVYNLFAGLNNPADKEGF